MPLRPLFLSVIGPLALFGAALIWGGAFIAQKLGMDYIGPYSFTCLRNVIGCVTLLVFMLLRRAAGIRAPHADEPGITRSTLLRGMRCGAALCVASLFQQVGLQWTTPGVSGFLTAGYILLVPIFGWALGKRPRGYIWGACIVALAGIWLICGGTLTEFRMDRGEALTLLCAACFAVQILFLERDAPRTDVVALSCIEFATCAVICAPFMLLPSERALLSLSAIWGAMPAIAFCGVLSSGVAYTLQALGQAYTPAALAALLMSLESVFSVLFGYLILGDVMTRHQAIGCVLLFAAVVFSQVYDILFKRSSSK